MAEQGPEGSEAWLSRGRVAQNKATDCSIGRSNLNVELAVRLRSKKIVQMEPPQTRYTRSGDVHIAYQVLGEGPLDLLYVSGLIQHVELAWETHQPPFLCRLASLGCLLRFDKRGTGMSDRDVGFPILETRMPGLHHRGRGQVTPDHASVTLLQQAAGIS